MVTFLKFVKENSYHDLKLVRNWHSYNSKWHTPEQNSWDLNGLLYQALYFGNLENQVRMMLTSGKYVVLVESFKSITHTHTHTPPYTQIVLELQKRNWEHEFLFVFAIQLVKNTLDVHGLHQDYLVLFHFLFFIEFVRQHWLIKLYKFQVYNSTYNTSSVYCAVCLPPQVKSPSITIYPSSILFYIFYMKVFCFFF